MSPLYHKAIPSRLRRPIALGPQQRAYYGDLKRTIRKARKEIFGFLDKRKVLERFARDAAREQKAISDEKFIERVILSDMRGTLENTAANLEVVMYDHAIPAWNTGGRAGRIRLGIPGKFNLKSPIVMENIAKRAGALAEIFTEDMAEGMVKTILDGFYVQGKNPLQVARMLNGTLDGFEIGRARHTARTETGIAVEQSQHEVYKTSAVEKKIWTSTLDTKTRLAHAEAHGQEKPLDKPYIVGGEKLMHPLDPTGSPENIVSCRCDSLPKIEGVEIVAEDIWNGS